MLLCTRCKKRPAVVFVSNGMDSQNPQGLCLVCAKELGIKPVNDIMEKMGITDEELEAATEQMTQLMNLDNDDSGDELFAPGGAATLPVDQMLGGRPGENGGFGSAGVQQKKESFHKKKRKHIQNFCTDLTAKARNGQLDNIIGRRRNSAGGADPLPPHQEQPLPYRRARRGQNRRGRGPGFAHRPGGGPCQAAG